MINDALKNIMLNIKTDPHKGAPVIIFNGLSWNRDDPVYFDQGEAFSVQLSDVEGNDIPIQLLGIKRYSDNSIKRAEATFIAREILSIGYKTYYITPRIDNLRNRINNENKIETPFCRIELGKGGVKSMFDKELRVELLNTKEFLGGVFTM